MKKPFGTVIVVVVALLPATLAAQTRVTFVPSLSLSSVYDDNLFARRVGSGDQLTLLTPAFEFGYDTSITTFHSEYSFDMERSIGHEALNNLDARRRAIVSLGFRKTARLAMNFIGRYDRTNAAGALNFNTGILFDRRLAMRWELNPSLTYRPSPRSTITTLYDITTESAAFTAIAHEHVARFNFMRLTSPRTTLGVGYLGRYFVNGPETHVSNAALFGWTYTLAPSVSVTMTGGPRASSRGTLAPEFVFALGRRVPGYFAYGFDVWRGESIILGVTGPVEVFSMTGQLSWPIRSNIEFGLHGGKFDSSTLDQGRAHVYHAETVAAWSPAALFVLSVSYGADFQRGDLRTNFLVDREVVRRVFQVRLTVAPRLSRSLQPDDPLRPLGDPAKGVQR